MMDDFSDQHLLSSLAHRNPYSQDLKMILMTSTDTEYVLASWRKRQDKAWLYIYCTNMAVFFSPSPDGGAEMNLDGEPQMKLKEIIRGLQAELQEHKLNFRDLEEKFILCQSTVYTLANEFQKYRSGAEEESGKEQKLLAFSLRQAPQEEKEILQDLLNEGCNTCPSHSESSDIHQPTCFSADLLGEHEVSLSLAAAHDYPIKIQMHFY
ncbi:uncharacterized protein LOC144368643 [Ictidomys tridecemlineatus]